MIWEVDEDLDLKIRWKEYEMMFKKCMKDERDRKGLEPRALFNLVRFMMFDNQQKGLITAEDTYGLLFVRWNANMRYFQKLKAQDQKIIAGVKGFDDQIYELFGFKPDQNLAVLQDPENEVSLTFFEYLDKINELAIEFRKIKK